MLNKSWKQYCIVTLIVITLGISSRKISGVPVFFGDVLYAVMTYFAVRMFFNQLKVKTTAFLALAFCFFIEISQLYQAEWMVEIRNTTLGHYVLGQGFLWSDLGFYTLGVLTALLMDFKIIKRR
jgi:hypothetical protein